MPFVNLLVHSYTCCSDRHASPYWTSIRRWISMGFTPSLLKKRMTDAVLLWCMLQAGPPFLHYYCAAVLHSCIVLPPVGHSSNHEYHCCQLTRQSNCVSNFYRSLKVFIWLSLVLRGASLKSRTENCVGVHRTQTGTILIIVQRDATVRSLFYFTARSLYMFRVSSTPIIRST